MSDLDEAKAFAERYNLLLELIGKHSNKYETAENYIERMEKNSKATNERIKKLHLENDNLVEQINISICAELSRLYCGLIDLSGRLKSNSFKNLKKDVDIAADIIFKYIPPSHLKT